MTKFHDEKDDLLVELSLLGDGWHASVEYTFDAAENGTVMFRNALGTQDIGNCKSDMAKA